MAAGDSVSNGTLWDTRRPPRGNVALPSMGALLGGPYNTLLTHGTTMEHVCKNLEHKESSSFADSNKGSGTEAPQIGAAEQEQVNLEGREGSVLGTSDRESYTQGPQMGATGRSLDEQKRGRTSLIGREHLPFGSCTLENLECLQRRSALWVSKLLVEIAAVPPKSGPEKLSSERLLLGTLVAANLGLPKEVSGILHRHPVHQGSAEEGPVRPGQSCRNTGGTHRAQENGSCRPGILPRVVGPRGPDRLGNLVTLGPLKGLSGGSGV
jgi:hypothetical protein